MLKGRHRLPIVFDGLYLGMANPMNLFPKGGWELIRLGGTDVDGDNVPSDVEDGAPNGGDGNGDDIPDRDQPKVASLPSANGTGYVTVEIQSGCEQVTGVQTYVESPDDLNFVYPYGLVGFQFGWPCKSAVVRLYFHGASKLNGARFTYRKYGPIPPDFDVSHWYTLPGVTFGAKNIKGEDSPYAELTLTDGQLGDDTWVDGVIYDQGGPARLISSSGSAGGCFIATTAGSD